MSYTTKTHAVKAAMAIAEDVTAGRVQVSDLEQAAVDQCRELFGVVYGPDDALWALHGDIARQYLHAGGMSVDELSEWLAVLRTREGLPVMEPEPSWIEQALAAGGDEDNDELL